MTVFLFLAALVAALVLGAWLGRRIERAHTYLMLGAVEVSRQADINAAADMAETATEREIPL